MARARSQVNALARLLAGSPCPIYAMDDRRTIIYCNPACAELVGTDAEQLVGQRCEYHMPGTGSGPAEVAAGLCPPPEVFSGDLSTADVNVLRSSGELVRRRAEYLPLGREPSQCVGVVALLWSPAPGGSTCEQTGSESAELHRRLARLRRDLLAEFPVEELIGASPAIDRIRRQIDLAAKLPTNVLVIGPTGSGREHVARLIHQRRVRDSLDSSVPLWCPLLDAELLQSTIAAVGRQIGSLDRSAGRVPAILLLEVDQLAADAQSELKGFLQLPGFGLCCAATATRPLLSLARTGEFPMDLAHVLSTLVIEMPALADRREDIPLLCQHYLEKFNAEGNRQLSGFTPQVIDELSGYGWPENIDELAGVVGQACRAATASFVGLGDLPSQIRWATSAEAHPRRKQEPIKVDEFLAEIEAELITRALRLCKGNKTKAARMLGMTRARFHRRLDHFQLP